jgi:hypothetical protein
MRPTLGPCWCLQSTGVAGQGLECRGEGTQAVPQCRRWWRSKGLRSRCHVLSDHAMSTPAAQGICPVLLTYMPPTNQHMCSPKTHTHTHLCPPPARYYGPSKPFCKGLHHHMGYLNAEQAMAGGVCVVGGGGGGRVPNTVGG